MDAAGVDAAFIHPPTSWDPDSNEQAMEAVEAHPNRFAILAYPPLDTPESHNHIATWKKRPGVVGCRFCFRAWTH
jgi:predicted TIM-barrel fold metal-dependent hydrolase